MSYTLDKLKEARARVDRDDIIGARKLLDELITVKQRQWEEYRKLREVNRRQRNMEIENDR